MRIRTDGYPLPVSQAFCALLSESLDAAGVPPGRGAIVNFRDPSYGPETGGYHPVEVLVGPGGEIGYVTDFSYVGADPFVELAKEIDFDLSAGVFGHLGADFPIARGRQLYRMWETHFLSYHRGGAYEVEVTAID